MTIDIDMLGNEAVTRWVSHDGEFALVVGADRMFATIYCEALETAVSLPLQDVPRLITALNHAYTYWLDKAPELHDPDWRDNLHPIT